VAGVTGLEPATSGLTGFDDSCGGLSASVVSWGWIVVWCRALRAVRVWQCTTSAPQDAGVRDPAYFTLTVLIALLELTYLVKPTLPPE
jgi:hypothetical protein